MWKWQTNPKKYTRPRFIFISVVMGIESRKSNSPATKKVCLYNLRSIDLQRHLIFRDSFHASDILIGCLQFRRIASHVGYRGRRCSDVVWKFVLHTAGAEGVHRCRGSCSSVYWGSRRVHGNDVVRSVWRTFVATALFSVARFFELHGWSG